MTEIFSLQGAMAVGKTTATKYIEQHAPYIHISLENNDDVIKTIKTKKLDKNKLEDYIEIQKLWIQKEIIRYEKVQKHPYVLMDLGAEEIEFYTLNYPRSMGLNWDIEDELHNELQQLRACLPTRILFLEGSDDILIDHKMNDLTRSRNFFDYHLQYLLPLKREWFKRLTNVDYLKVDKLSKEKLGTAVKQWLDKNIKVGC